MEIPTAYIDKFKPAAAPHPGAPRSERDELLNMFCDRLNPDRVKDGYQPYSPSRLAKILKDAGFKQFDWLPLYKSCDRARSFGRLFSHLTKTKV